jgi:hypothetical protein
MAAARSGGRALRGSADAAGAAGRLAAGSGLVSTTTGAAATDVLVTIFRASSTSSGKVRVYRTRATQTHRGTDQSCPRRRRPRRQRLPQNEHICCDACPGWADAHEAAAGSDAEMLARGESVSGPGDATVADDDSERRDVPESCLQADGYTE